MSHTPEEIRHHVKIYLRVFAALAVLTGLTVAVSYLHLPILAAVAVALFIACIKGSLVAGFFMHLVNERKILLYILILAVALALPLFCLPLFHY